MTAAEYRDFAIGLDSSARARKGTAIGDFFASAALALRSAAEMREALEKEAATAPPSEWEPYDRYGDYNGYRGVVPGTGRVIRVDEVDPSNSGDAHNHGYAVGHWAFACVVRTLLGDKP